MASEGDGGSVTTPFRTPDLAAENDRLRARVAELEAKPKREPKPWTYSQRVVVRLAVGAASFAMMAMSLAGAEANAAHHQIVAVFCGVGATCSVNTIFACASGHWDWWRGIGGGE